MTLHLLYWTLLFICLGLMLRLLIGRRQSSAPPHRIPVPLEKWGFVPGDQGKSPWPSKRHPIIVTIVAVQDDWVRYYHGREMGGPGSNNDCRERLATFLSVYRPWPPKERQ